MSAPQALQPLTRLERERLIFVTTYIEAAKHAAQLRKMYEKRKSRYTPEWDALFTGWWEVHCKANKSLEHALGRGQLLFCFEGTTVLHQAVPA